MAQFPEVAAFNADLLAMARSIDGDLEMVVRALTLSAYSRVTIRTPVDKGTARASWNVAVGRPDDSVQEQEGGTTAANAVVNAKTTEYARLDVQGGFKEVYITNALPYIQALEAGSSQRNPEGMIGITFAEMQQMAEDAAGAVNTGNARRRRGR